MPKNALFYNGFEYSDGMKYVKSPRGVKPIIGTISLDSCIPILLDHNPDTPDSLLSACMRTKQLDFNKRYALCKIQMFDEKILVLALEEKLLRIPSVPSILLPLGHIDTSLVSNSMFCLDSSLAIFYSGKLLHVSKYLDFGDIFSGMELAKERYGINVEKIYVNENYESISSKTQNLESLGEFFLANCALNLYKNSPHFFLMPPKMSPKNQFLLLMSILVGFIGGIFLLWLFLDSKMAHHEEASPIQNPLISEQKEPVPMEEEIQEQDYTKRSELISQILSLAIKYKVLITQLDFTSHEDNLALAAYACFRELIDFMNWVHEFQVITNMQGFYGAENTITPPYSCSWVSWTKF